MPRLLDGGPTLAVSRDQATVAVLDRGRLCLLDVRQRREIASTPVKSTEGGALAWATDDSRILVVTQSEEATSIAAHQTPSLDRITLLEMPAHSRAIAFAGDFILVIESTGEPKLVKLTTKLLVADPIPLRAIPRVASEAPEGRVLVEARGQLEFWHPVARRALFRLNLPLPESPTGIGFTGRGRLLWVSARNHFEVFRFSDGRPQLALDLGREIVAVEASPSTNRVILGLRDGESGQIRLMQIDLGLREQQELELDQGLAAFAVVEGQSPLIVAAPPGAPLAFVSLSKASGAARGVQLPPPAASEETFSLRAPEASVAAEEPASGGDQPRRGKPGSAADRFAAWRARLQNGRTVEATEPVEEAEEGDPPTEEEEEASAVGTARSTPAPSIRRSEPATAARPASAASSAYANWRASRGLAAPKSPASEPVPVEKPRGLAAAKSAASEPVPVEKPRTSGRSLAQRIAESRRDPDSARGRVVEQVATGEADPEPMADEPEAAPASEEAASPGARWREPLVAWARRTLVEPSLDEPPPLDEATPINLLAERFSLEPIAVRALALLYGMWLAGDGQPGIAVADLAQAIGDDADWTESFGRGELGRAGIAHAHRGRLRLRRIAGEFLDGAPPRTTIAKPTRATHAASSLTVSRIAAGDETTRAMATRFARILKRPVAAIDLNGLTGPAGSSIARAPERILEDGLFDARVAGAIALVGGIPEPMLVETDWLARVGDGPALIALAGDPPPSLEHLPLLRAAPAEPAS
jgi:hypothetical protein